MGIKPSGTTPIIVPQDNVQSRWGAYEASLDTAGSQAGEVFQETHAIATSANETAGLAYDGQLDLGGRVDLLEGVQGYCAAYQSWNVNAEWGLDNWRWLPYDRPLGPAKNMNVDQSKGEIVLHTPGMFVVYAKAQARGTSFGGANFVYMDVVIMRPNGSTFTYTRVEKFVPPNQHQTVSVAWPFVVDFPGARVAVEVYSDNWRYWDGGTRYSTLHVIQHSNTSINPGSATVPDEIRP